MDELLTDAQRFPLLTERGREMLRRLREDPHAPRFDWPIGDRLDAEGLRRVRDYQAQLETAPRGWRWGEPPPWVKEFACFCLREVPIYRDLGGSADDFAHIPPTNREDLAREPWAFVPDSQPLDGLIWYTTSGTTGPPVTVLSHPEASGKYLPLLCRALATRGVVLEGGSSRVSLLQVRFHKWTGTGVAVLSFLHEAGHAKVNLNPECWHNPEDRARYLDSCNPEVYTGDPVAFAELAKLPLQSRPRALISVAMPLRPGFAQELERRFGCPVVDIYSMTEAGPIAVGTPRGYEILPHDLYIELLDANGAVCQPGERGIVTLTGGRNPFFPLLRYQTEDWASLDFSGVVPVLTGLEGRPQPFFRNREGQLVSTVSLSKALGPFALPQYALHQAEDGALLLKIHGANVPHHSLREALVNLFGQDQVLHIEEMADEEVQRGKTIHYSSALRP